MKNNLIGATHWGAHVIMYIAKMQGSFICFFVIINSVMLNDQNDWFHLCRKFKIRDSYPILQSMLRETLLFSFTEDEGNTCLSYDKCNK